MTIALDSEASPRDLISAHLYARLVKRVMQDAQVDLAHAQRVVTQTLVFLKACADNPGSKLSPTKVVDPGWHAFILHTEEYARFCDRIAGRFIHHRPTCDGDLRSGMALAQTVGTLEETGYSIDRELWQVDIADCNQCHAGCHDSP